MIIAVAVDIGLQTIFLPRRLHHSAAALSAALYFLICLAEKSSVQIDSQEDFESFFKSAQKCVLPVQRQEVVVVIIIIIVIKLARCSDVHRLAPCQNYEIFTVCYQLS